MRPCRGLRLRDAHAQGVLHRRPHRAPNATLTIDLHAAVDFRYLFAMNSYNSGSAARRAGPSEPGDREIQSGEDSRPLYECRRTAPLDRCRIYHDKSRWHDDIGYAIQDDKGASRGGAASGLAYSGLAAR